MKEKIVLELINYLIKENNYEVVIPNTYEKQRFLLKALINTREPKPISEEILKLEDKLLKLENNKIADINSLNMIEDNIILYLGDITNINSDIIVNAGNSDGLGCFNPYHNCIDNVIHTKAGMRLRLECNQILKGKKLHNGDIIVCNSYNLPCKKIITTKGPQIKSKVTVKDRIDLGKCYENTLIYAIENNYNSITFPSISTGLYSFPISEAKQIAYNTVKEILKKYNTNIKVIFNVFSEDDYNEYKQLFKS